MEEPEICLFEGITRYDREAYRRFLRYHYCHVNPWLPAVLVLLGAVLAVLGFWQIHKKGGTWFSTMAISCLFAEFCAQRPAKAISIPRLFAALLAFLLLWSVTSDKARLTFTIGTMCLYIGANLFLGRFGSFIKEAWDDHICFFDDRIRKTNWVGEAAYPYRQILRLREMEQYFVLYTEKNQVIMVKKAGLTLGTADQLREFLHQKITPQYK